VTSLLDLVGDLTLFGVRAVTGLFRRPFEREQIRQQLAASGRSLCLS